MDRERAKVYKRDTLREKLNLESNTEVYSTTGNNVEKIIAARKELYRTLLKKFPNRPDF